MLLGRDASALLAYALWRKACDQVRRSSKIHAAELVLITCHDVHLDTVFRMENSSTSWTITKAAPRRIVRNVKAEEEFLMTPNNANNLISTSNTSKHNPNKYIFQDPKRLVFLTPPSNIFPTWLECVSSFKASQPNSAQIT